MNGLDDISLDASGFLDMDSFSDGSELSDDVLAGLRDALLSDPVDEPGPDDWSAFVSEVVDEGEGLFDDGGGFFDEGPFTVDGDGGGLAGMRDASADDDPAGDGAAGDDRDDVLGLDDDAVTDDASVDDGTGFDLDGGDIDIDGLIGLDLLDHDGGLDVGDAAAELVVDDGPEMVSDTVDDVGDVF